MWRFPRASDRSSSATGRARRRPRCNGSSPRRRRGSSSPILFSQGQAILTRTWIPTQDSPGIRQTYDARIVVPSELQAVMSAEQLTPDGDSVAAGRAFGFRMAKPVPPYLIALAVGDLAFRPIGARTGVYAEPSVLDARGVRVHRSREDGRRLRRRLCGPYRWGRYDVLVLPPSFPFGGMENPRLTFATPTVLAGDRSLVSLIAHELAHSWSGNLVTNATWSDFWLNEAFTTYFENRDHGGAVWRQARTGCCELLGRRGYWTSRQARRVQRADTSLHLDLAGRDPDEG